ncbi:RrF2 family transcriptional regulator [Thalassospira marina]|uniref:Rrf2 family transcriptional regulator n=1 Tax=Thalassospira marina TaxID=2048283 RepID=A0A2N3KYT1_9PROT|nr:Rrf2 family transcriptional regulator [Thalassospira marina]PKR55647.1 Rrf2 family transcriptional regulator [Thalassospira marina]
MRLTVFSDYTLRTLLYLALRTDGLVTIDEIAKAYGISRNHLMKVVHNLSRTGIVKTVRGKGGGMTLARSPQEINIGAVVRETEKDSHVVECFDPERAGCCQIDTACSLKGALYKAREAFFGVLDDYTLDDLLGPRQRMAEMLGIGLNEPLGTPAL